MNFVSLCFKYKEVPSGSVNGEWQCVRLCMRQLVEGGRGAEGGEQVIPMGLSSASWLAASTWTVTASRLCFCGLANVIIPETVWASRP